MVEKEEGLRQLREQEAKEFAMMQDEFDSEESEDLDPRDKYKWFNFDDKSNYFILSTRNKNIYEENDQVFHFYGRQNNRYLLKNYGFLLAKNKYNSVTFKVLLDFGTLSGQKNDDSDTESDNRV